MRRELIIFVVAVVLIAFSLLRLLHPPGEPMLPAVQLAPLRPLPVAKPRSVAIAESSWSRPLFSTPGSNQPRVTTSDSPTPANRNETIPHLVGVLMEGDVRIAILRTTNDIKRVRQNTIIGEWTVIRIDPRSVHLHGASRSEVLHLDPQPKND